MATNEEIAKRYKAWKEKQEESGQLPRYYANSKERYQAYAARLGIESGEINLNDVMKGINSRIDSWGKGVQSLSNGYKARFGEGVDRSVYRPDTSSYLETVTGQRNQFDTEAEEIKSLLRVYGQYLNDDYVKSVSDYFDGNKDFFDGVIEHATIDNDYWSQWGSEEEYKNYLNEYAQYKAYEQDIINWDYNSEKAEVDQREKDTEEYRDMYGAVHEEIALLGKKIDAGYRLYDYTDYKGKAQSLSLEQMKDRKAFLEQLLKTGSFFQDQAFRLPGGATNVGIKELSGSSVAHTLDIGIMPNQGVTPDYETDFDAERANLKAMEYSYEGFKLGAVANPWSELYDPEFEEYAEKGCSGITKDDIKGVDGDYITNKEFKVYGYYKAKDKENGTNLAEKYVYYIKQGVNEKKGQDIADNLKVNFLGQLGYGAWAGLEQVGSGIAGWFADEYTPTSATQYASAEIREDIGEDNIFKWYNFKTGEWNDMTVFGNTTGQVLYDVGNTTANMLPSILTSTAVGAVATPTVGAAVGSLLLGASAGGNAKVEMLNLGYSEGQATAYGLMVGSSEAGLEYLLSGIPGLRGSDGAFSALGNKVISKVDNAMAKAAIALGGDMLDEGLEEGLQTVLENWFKEIATGVDFENPSVDEILYSSLLGSLTAAGFGGGKLAVNGVHNIANQTAIGKSFNNKLSNNGKAIGDLTASILGLDNKKATLQEGTAAYKQAQKIQTRLDKGKRVGSYSIGALAMNLSESQQISAVQSRLSAHMENKTDLSQMSRTIVDIMQGRKVSDKALYKVIGNKYAFNAMNDIFGAKLKKGATINDVRAAIKSYQAVPATASGKASEGKQSGSAVKKSGQNGATFTVSENADGGYDVIAEAGGERMVMMHYETQRQAQAAAYAQTLDMGAEGTRGLVMISESLPDGANLGDTAQAFNAIYTQGRSGKAFSAVRFGETLTAEQRQYAYQLGIMDRALEGSVEKTSKEVLQKDVERDTIKENAQEGVENEREIVSAESSDADPNVQQAKENSIDPERIVYSSKKAMAYDAVAEDQLDGMHKKAFDIGKAIGRKVVVADTATSEGIPVDGFLGKDGVIYISKNNKSPVAFIFKHELTHFCERAGQKYRDFANAVRNSAAFKSWIKEKGYNSMLDYNSKLRQERASIGQDPGELGANNEIIGNFVGDMMFGDDTTLADRLIGELKPKERRSVKEFLRDFFGWIKSRLTGKNNTARTEIHRLEKMFAQAFRTAVNVEQESAEQFAYVKKGSYIRKTQYYYNNIPFINKNFPPENEVYSEAHRLAVWWARRADVESGYQTIISLNNRYYLVEKFDDALNYYQVVAGVYTQDVKRIEKEIKNRGNVGRIKSIQRVDAGYDLRNSSDLSNENGGSGSNSSVVGHRRKDTQVENLAASSHSGGERTGRDGVSDSRSGGNDRQGQDVEEQFSYNSQNDKIDDVVERYRNGEITLDELKTLLKKPEGDDPVKIANLKKEDMGSTPPLNKKTTGKVGDSDSRFARSVEKSKIFDEKFKEEVNDDNFVKHYASITNKETLAEAANRLDEGGEAYVNEWFNKKAVHMDTVDTMVGFILLKRYQDAGNYRSAAAIAQKVREVGTLSGQRVQAFSIIGRFDADMMQVYAQKELDKAWEFAKQNRSDKWLEKHKEQFNLTEDDISFIRNNILYASNLPENSRERAIALSQITSLIQSKIPPIRGQSYKAWQRISMLLNPKTQIRNIAGNALMAPVFVASDWFSTPIDYIISKKTGVRTTGLTGIHGNKDNFKAMGKGIYESFDDWKRHINTKAAEQNRFEIGEGKSFDETKWGRIAKIMNGFDRFTAFLLDAGDRPFYELWFTNSLNEQMRLNKVSEPTEEMVQIAVDEALSRTWQDENRMTKLVSGIKKACNQIQIAGYGLGDVIVKFTKTPANLTKAIYDFSPAAIVTITPQAIRLAKAIKNGTATPSMQKKFVSNFGKMAAGTMLYVAFAALYAAGHITGSSDDDDDVAAFEKYIQGMPEYSIKIGDTWFSYDWAQPIGAVPAIIAEYMEAKDAGGKGVDNLLSAFKAGGEVLFNQSFMSSFQTLFSTNGFSEGMLDLALGEVTVPVPTVFSQLANVLDDKRRVTYDSTSEVKSAVNRAMLKIPGLRNMLEAEVDVLGREVENSQKNWFNAFFNPANVYTDTSSDVTDHAYEIYQSTKDVGAIPAKAPYSVTLQGKTVKLDDAQRAQYQKAMGEAASDLIEILLENDVYKAMSDQEKLSVLKQVYSYSAAVAKNQLEWADDFEVISGIAPYITEKNYDAMSYEERYKIVEDYIFSDYEGMENIESDIGQSNFLINKKTSSLVLEATLAGDMDTAVKLINGIDSRVESYGWSESDAAAEIKERKTSVKTTITRYWKAAYLYAYYSDNKDEQEKIKNMLVEIGLYGKEYDVKKTLKEWVKNSENDS